MATHNNIEQQNHFLNTFNSNQDKKINYPSLMQLLNHQYVNKIEPTGTNYTNKVKVEDRQKLIIRNILVAIKICMASQRNQAYLKFSHAAKYISTTIKNRNEIIKSLRPKQTDTKGSLTT